MALMKVQSYIPTEQLQPFIKTYFIVESDEDIVNRIVPDTGITLVFRFKGNVNLINDNYKTALPVVSVSGIRKSARLINYEKNSGNIIVRLRETATAAFLNMPAHELFENNIPLKEFFRQNEMTAIEEQLAAAQNNFERIVLTEKFLLSKLASNKRDCLVENAIQRIYLATGAVKIKDLASGLYISQDAFEKRFRKAVGASPKQFASIVRMQTTIKQKQASRNFTDLAHHSSYFDQAHFIKDFKRFTGLTPTDFFRQPPVW